MSNVYGGPDIFERGFGWMKDKWNNLPKNLDIGGNQGEKGSILAGTKQTPDAGGFNLTNPFSWGGNTTLGAGGYGAASQTNQNPNIQREEDYGDTPGANNLLARSQETREGYNEEEMQIPDYSGSVNSMTTDATSLDQKVVDATQKKTDSNRPFKNLFQKMKGGLGNIGSAKFDEEAFGPDGKTPNPNYGKYLRDPKDPTKIIGKGKGIFGKEGGFMSKFGTGKGAMAGLMGGLASGLGSMGEGGGIQAPEEYMYQNPWEGVE